VVSAREFFSIPVTHRRYPDNEQKNRDAQFASENGQKPSGAVTRPITQEGRNHPRGGVVFQSVLKVAVRRSPAGGASSVTPREEDQMTDDLGAARKAKDFVSLGAAPTRIYELVPMLPPMSTGLTGQAKRSGRLNAAPLVRDLGRSYVGTG
jgi:hypothetical protein